MGNENAVEPDTIVSSFETHDVTGLHPFSTFTGIDRLQH